MKRLNNILIKKRFQKVSVKNIVEHNSFKANIINMKNIAQ